MPVFPTLYCLCLTNPYASLLNPTTTLPSIARRYLAGNPVMKVAVIGGGVAGMAAAHSLDQTAEVTLFESRARLGGHTDTHNLFVDGRSHAIDSGFIAFNAQNYPRFCEWLKSLDVSTRRTDMSFGVDLGASATTPHATNLVPETIYGTADIGALFSARRNLVNARFLRMLMDISRFYRESRKLNALHSKATLPSASITLGDYLDERRYSHGFIEDHLLPLCVALWTTTVERARDLPLGHVLAFLDSHKLLQLDERPDWLVVDGGSNRYVSAFLSRYGGELRLATPVVKVQRKAGFVRVHTHEDNQQFDRVVFACHADQALEMIDATSAEREILGAFRYETHRSIVHSDTEFMPSIKKAWSSWNVVGPNRNELQLTSWLNRLQAIESAPNFFVTVDPVRQPRTVWAEREYQLPLVNAATEKAQTRRDEISGHNLSHFAGAYWGLGTHEDAFASGASVSDALSVSQPQVAATA